MADSTKSAKTVNTLKYKSFQLCLTIEYLHDTVLGTFCLCVLPPIDCNL